MNIVKRQLDSPANATLFGPLTFLLRKLNLKITFEDSCVNEVLLYGAENEEQRMQIGLNNLYCIHFTMIHASKSIDFCIPRLTSDVISKCLVNVAKKGDIPIRLITYNDNKMRYKNLLEKHGVQIKVMNLKMEHEFLLIDAEERFEDSIAIMGALDYDVPDVINNRGNTLLVSDVKVVETLKREFDRIWNQMDVDQNNQ